MIALVLAAAVAASDAPLGAVDMAATAAKVHQRCNDSLRRILACTASGVPADVCKQGVM